MDATTWFERPCAIREQRQPVTVMHEPSELETSPGRISVMVLCVDPIIAAGLEGVLREHSDFELLPAPEPSDRFECLATVDVVLADYQTAMRVAGIAPQWVKNLMIFTNYDSEARICRALERGARGYLLYGLGLPELFAGIRSVHGGGVALSPSVAARMTSRMSSQTLTRREKAVLEHLMLGLSNKVIAHRLNLSVGTVKTHVKAILEKLDADSRTAAVVTAQRRGLLS